MSAGHLYTMSLRATKSSSLELTSGPHRACDRCRRRKTRCDSQQTCAGCRKVGAACTYDIPSQRKGSKRRKDRMLLCSSISAKETSQQQDPLPQHWDVQQPSTRSLLSSYSTERTNQSSAVEDDFLVGTTTYGSPYEDLDASNALDNFVSDSAAGLDNHSSYNQLSFDSLLPDARIVSDKATGSLPNTNVVGPNPPSALPLPRRAFQPYLQLFFRRLYPIFPVVDRQVFLDNFLTPENHKQPLQPGEYAFLTALSAAVVLQLNVTDLGFLLGSFSHDHASNFPSAETEIETFSADFLISQCLQTRQQWPFMETADELTILTSFFLFAYHGNLDQPRSAWYYLREAICFALSLRLGEESSYVELDIQKAEQHCRLFWLLFITERAYSLQHRNEAILRPSIKMPRVFASEDPRLVYGFVTLVKVFQTVDEEFITAWKGLSSSSASSLLDIPKSNYENATQSAEDLGPPGSLQSHELDETQRVDIMVTQQWLRVLIWQMHVSQGTANHQTFLSWAPAGRNRVRPTRTYPFDVSHGLLGLISTADRRSLESHGIGMEQKIFDVACCLSDVLKLTNNLTAEEFSSGHNMLYGFMTLLAGFRNQESRYLQPLVQKAANILSDGMSVSVISPTAANLEQEA